MRSIALTIACVLLLFAVSGIFAQEAVIKELTGTVELKKAGSSVWESAARGQTLMQDTIISTGFKSSALIGIGNSVLTVRPLTRLSLKELSSTREAETINVSLQTGRLRVDVKPPAETRANYFTVQTPPATASVRGTVFEVDLSGLWVIEGTVVYKSVSGNTVLVDAGGNSFVDGNTGRAAMQLETKLAELTIVAPIGTDAINTPNGVTQTSGDLVFIGQFDYD